MSIQNVSSMYGIRSLASDILYNSHSLKRMAQFMSDLANSLYTVQNVDGSLKFEHVNVLYNEEGMTHHVDQALSCYIRNAEYVLEQLKALDIQTRMQYSEGEVNV